MVGKWNGLLQMATGDLVATPMAYATKRRLSRHIAIQIKAWLVFFVTKDQNSSNSRIFEAGLVASGPSRTHSAGQAQPLLLSRSNALSIIAEELVIKQEEIVAFGDNHIYIGMRRLVDIGAVMGNAHREVKAAADYVTLSTAENGVAERD
jgi:hydroxymethylpyrimidine pyrophosphatase-like HAD family hydrolase